jgi:hypothetical protein
MGGLNLYRFVHNSPVNRVDPFGEDYRLVNANGLYTPGPFGYLEGDTTFENLTAGAYNALPSVANISVEALNGLDLFIKSSSDFAGYWFSKLTGNESDGQLVSGFAAASMSMLPLPTKCFGAAKTAPVWPNTAQEMNAFLKVEGKAIPDTLMTQGRNKTVWELGPNKITLEQHPYHPNAPTWHKDPHWHLDTPGNPHQRFLPGDPIPGY